MIKICKFPTQIVCVDDNESFIKGLELTVNFNNNTFISFSNPHLVGDYLNKIICDHNFLKKNISIDIDEDDLLSVDLNINNLYKEIYNSHRFRRISLFITDYDMPGITGLELCKKLNDTPINRVLLTGVAEESIAIQAFNDGLIEQFIRKQDRSTIDNLEALITKSQTKYFNYISNSYVNLFTNNQKSLDILSNSNFINLFNEIIRKEKIIEYYLLDSTGSFLTLKSDGTVSALFVITPEQHEEMLSFAQYENCPSDILKKIQNKTNTLCFYENSQYLNKNNNSEIDWVKYLIPIKPLIKENDILYYSYTDNVPFIHKEKIISFDQYKLNNFSSI